MYLSVSPVISGKLSELEAVNITGTDIPAISGNTAEERNREKASSEDIYSTLLLTASS